MIVYLFDMYFNPLLIQNITQSEDDVLLWFSDTFFLRVTNAKIYDVAASINAAIKEFSK